VPNDITLVWLIWCGGDGMIASEQEINMVLEEIKKNDGVTIRNLSFSIKMNKQRLYFILGVLLERKKITLKKVGNSYAIFSNDKQK